MSNDNRHQYNGAASITQAFLDASQDNLLNKLEMVVDIELPSPPGGYIRASDRNKYLVDGSGVGTFYEALLTFPTIKRTVGDYLSPQLEFSQLELELSNVDGRFNQFLPAGGSFSGWIGKSVTVRLGLGETESTYRTIFKGYVTDQGGFRRNVSTVKLIARDRFESANKSFPNAALTESAYPSLEEDKKNILVPIIYGDWTVNVEPNMASVPAIPVNGANPNVNGDTDHTVNVQLVIANHALAYFDTTQVYLRRGDNAWLIPAGDVVNVSIGGAPSSFEIVQNSGTMTPVTPDTDAQVLEFGRGDEFFVKIKGLALGGGLDDNAVAQAKDILKTYGGLVDGDFHANWAAFAAKASPAESAIASIKSRVWLQEPENVMEYVLSLLEQVRLEAFIDRDLIVKILPLHLDEFVANPSYLVRNWDVEQGSFKLQIDERINFNRAKGVFNFLPNRKENYAETKIYKNQASIDQAGKPISKKLVYPNLYEEAAVIDQLKETLRITSAYLENVEANLTWRSLLLDIGDFVRLNVQIQSTVLENVPALIREIGYDPAGVKLPTKLWSFQMLPFSGWAPGYAGTVGGSTATIEEDV